MDWSFAALNAEVEAGSVTCEEILGAAKARASDPKGEGIRIFRERHYERALETARAYDLLRAHRACPFPLAGLPVSVKDNMDVHGQISAAGSKVLLEGTPAKHDAPGVARLRRAGAVIVGRTNMSELAFTGVGENPHFGTPANPFDRSTGRIPGGSSAGAAVSITDRMAVAALGTDTGGSVRIPAALTGIVGFKPTKRRVPTDGVVPLSTTLDCVGPLATTVADCALLDAIISGEDETGLGDCDFQPRLWLPSEFMLSGSDAAVQRTFERALTQITQAGATVREFQAGEFAVTQRIAARGSIATAEIWERFGPLLQQRRHDFDARVLRRIERGATMSAADYLANLRDRAEFIRRMEELTAPFDAIVAPTVPIIAPTLSVIADDEHFQAANALILRNPAVANLLDRPSISIPCHAANEAPVGLMLIGHWMQDRRLLRLANFLERVLAGERGRA